MTAISLGRPARFFLIAFAILALSVSFEALVTFGALPYLTPYGSQIGSAIEVILLQLALADRIKTISQEQDRIKHSLSLAREVQQNLLPHKNPKIDGLDLAGTSIYCDETGGDYYDYIDSNIDDHHIKCHDPAGRIVIAVFEEFRDCENPA